MRDHPTHKAHKQWLPIALLVFVATILTACSVPNATPTPKAAPTAVNMQLGWVHEYSSAGFYAAEKNGHFANENLAVTFIPGGFGEQGYIDPITQVAKGAADFGVASATNLIQARAAGKPLVGITAIFQRSPAAIIALGTSGIQRPQDLVGHRVAVSDNALGAYLLLLKSQHVDPTSVNTIPRTTFGIEPLANGEADAMYAWVINEGVQLREAGKAPTMLMLSDYGVETYDLVLFTTEKMIAEHPELVTRVLRASLQGWDDVVANPSESAKLALTYDPKLDLAGQQRRLDASLPLIKPAGSQLGAMQLAVWQSTQQVLIDQKLLEQPIDLSKAYTSSFFDALASK